VRESTAVEVITDADQRCELVHATEGRCARSTGGEIHITYRSHGGTDTRENLAYLCKQHHDQIHEGDLTGPPIDGNDRTVYSSKGGADRWYLWSQVKQTWEAEAVACDTGYQEAMQEASDSIFDACAWLAAMQDKALYQVLGHGSLAEYCRDVNINPKTGQAQARVGRWISDQDAEVRKLLTGEFMFWEAREMVGPLKRLPAGRAEQAIVEAIESKRGGMPAYEVIDRLRGADGGSQSDPVEW